MAFREVPRFFDDIAFGALGGPRFLTSVVISQGAMEQRNQHWRYPLHIYEVGLQHKDDATTRRLLAFFRVVAQGRRHGFRFRDFSAGEDTGLDEPLGTGTGASANYQLLKRYTSGAEQFDRPIYKPVVGSVVIKVDGAETTSFTVNTTTGVVTMTAAGGAVLTATYQFDVPVRFDSDVLAIRRVDTNVYSWSSIRLVTTRELT